MPDIQKLNVNGTDFDLDDPNDVEKEGGELLDTVINYDSATTPTIDSFTAFLNQFVSGTKVGQWFKNFRAGCDFLLHIGSIVNNCVSDNEALPLSAAQGKVLMDLYTELNDNLAELVGNASGSLQIRYANFPSITFPAHGNVEVNLTSSIPDGYKFLCSLTSESYNSVQGPFYIEYHDSLTTNVWNASSVEKTASIRVWFLIEKNL